MRTVWLVALLVSALLAGCTGDDGTTGDDGPTTGEGGQDNPGMENAGRVRSLATTASNDTITDTKSGPTPETLACVNGCDYLYYSISDLMEPDTAYFLEAKMTWTWGGDHQGAPSMQLIGNIGIRDYGGPESDNSAGTSTLTATLLPQHESEVQLRVGGGVDAPDHNIEITLTPVVDAVPQYASAAVTVPVGADLILETQSGDGRVAVFRGDDTMLGVVEIKEPEGNIPGMKTYSTTALNGSTEAEEFVMFTMDDIWLKVYVLQDGELEAPVLRHLALHPVYAELGVMDAGGDATFTYAVEKPPLNIGYRYGSEGCNVPADSSNCYVASAASHRMLDPSGTEILSGSQGPGGNCVCGGYNSWSLSYDDMPHATGDYTIEWTSSESRNVSIQAFSWTFVR